jgi:alpha-1,2-mannosyltransferase
MGILVHFSFRYRLRKFSAVYLKAINITEIWLDVQTVHFFRQNDHKESILRKINRKYVLVIQALIFSLIITVYLSNINPISRFPQTTDFYKFYGSAKLFWSGENIYKLIPITNPFVEKNDSVTDSQIVKNLHPNLNSPFHTLCMLLFGLLDFHTAFLIWSLFSLCCGLAAIALFYKNIVTSNISLIYLMNIWIIFLLYFPTWINIRLGQFSFVLLLLIAIAWKTSKMGKDFAAGIILGLATALKLFFGIFFILFIVYRRWRLIFCLLGTFMICNILSIVIFTLPTFENFLSLLQNMPWYGGSWNASFMGFFTRIFGGSMNIPLFNLPWLARTLSFVLSLALIGWMIWLAQPYSHRLASDRFDLVFSLALVQMLLISPYGWLYYFSILILPMIVAWRISEKYYFGIIYKILIVFAWALTTIPTSLIWAEDLRMNQPVIWFTSASIYFYALLIISGIFSGLLHKINKSLLKKEAV